MKKQIVDLSVFWESVAKHHAEEREDERRHIEAVLNQALSGVSAVSWSGMAIRGVRHIRVGYALGLSPARRGRQRDRHRVVADEQPFDSQNVAR